MKSRILITLLVVLTAITAFGQMTFSPPPSGISRGMGVFYAPNYAYGFGGVAPAKVETGNSATGSQTITVTIPTVALPDGRTLVPFSVTAPITIGVAGIQETVTPTAVSNCNYGLGPAGTYGISCSLTASFNQLHGHGDPIISGTFGLQEAINDAFIANGGTVVVDQYWAGGPASPLLGTSAILAAAVPYASVTLEDCRSAICQPWTPVSNATFIAVPTTDTGTTVGITVNGANSTGGFYTNANPYHTCRAYVDAMGNEGPCSLDFSFTPASGTTNQIGWTAPAASAGAVGWVAYISLTNGSYALAYRVPGCPGGTLTKVETVIAACAVTNATYGQTGSGMVVSALTLSSARIAEQLGAASTTTDIVSNSAAHTVYTYAPGAWTHPNTVIGSFAPFTVTTAAATTVPAILGTIQLPAGFMNQVGRTIRVCGKGTQAANGSTATITTIQLIWDADGSNTTGAGVIIGSGETLTSTLVTANADDLSFCEVLRTTVSGAGVTAGSIQDVTGWLVVDGAQTSTSNRAAGNNSVGATASLNLAGEARIDVQEVHTTGTDANGWILQSLSVEVLD